MTIFVIAGMPDCYFYNHARYIAEYLSKILPNFEVYTIDIDPKNWKTWIKEKNLENNWYHFKSPVVWKEIDMKGGKPHYIGGISEFWEYCYDYYGLVSNFKHDEIKELVNDSMQYYNAKDEVIAIESNVKRMNICIAGDQDKILSLLVMEILLMDSIFEGKNELTIKLYNPNSENKEIMGIKSMNEWSSSTKYTVDKVEDFQDGIKECDLFILTGNFTREKDEEFYKWLNRNYLSMKNLAEVLNEFAKRTLRIIIGIHGPVCFNVAVLINIATKISANNIVGVTADVGLEILKQIQYCVNNNSFSLCAPPVWGFIGINQLIDTDHVIEIYNVYRPNQRAVYNTYDSTLQLGSFRPELRYCYYHTLKDLWINIYNKNKDDIIYNPLNCYSKVRAIISLIKNWFSIELYGNIISLGIISNGSFGIPAGVVFSQPVQFKNNKWEPVKIFPVPRKDPADIYDFIPFISEIYRFFNIQENIF